MSEEKLIVAKMLSGEEIIGKVVPENSEELVLTDILAIVYIQQQDGRTGWMFQPYSPLTGAVKRINQDHITFVTEASDQLIEAYKKVTSPIVTPNKGLVLG